MELGGAEISLIGLLQSLDYSLYDVDLFIHRHQGELMQFIPSKVNLLPEISSYASIESPLLEAIVKLQLGIAWGRLKAKWRSWKRIPQDASKPQGAIFQFIAQEVDRYLPTFEKNGEYDLAISFLQPHNYLLDKVKAKKKVCWIHTDYTRLEFDVDDELPIWREYDHIVSISSDVSRTFLQVFPSLSGKIIEIENILSSDFVLERSIECDVSREMPKGNDNINILSIGRFHEQKNFDNIPDICRRVRDKGINLYWYIIGFGNDKLVRNKIKELGMEKYVRLLGKRSNPYPYIKNCDIYVQPSRYEGKSVSVREAQILCKPVVITNYPTAKSQIRNGIDGVIVPLENEACAEGLIGFIQDRDLQKKISQYLKTHNYENKDEVKKVRLLFE